MKMKEIHRSFTLSSQNGANFAGEKTKTRSLKEINSIYYITMSYLRFTKMFLLILACVMGGLSANAQTELASFSGKITGSEWTTDAGTSGSGKKFYYKMVTGTSITSPNVDVTGLNKYTFTIYNPQIQIAAESGTKRSIFRQKNKTKRSKNRLHTTLIKPEQKVNEDLCSGFVLS